MKLTLNSPFVAILQRKPYIDGAVEVSNTLMSLYNSHKSCDSDEVDGVWFYRHEKPLIYKRSVRRQSLVDSCLYK